MMSSLLLLSVAVAQTPAPSSQPPQPQSRYDVLPLIRLYQQSTPKQALESAIKAMEKGRYDYITAQLLDPAYVDRVASERGQPFAAEVEEKLRLQRIRENDGTSNVPREKRIPAEPEKLLPLINAECQALGFLKLVNDFKDLAKEDPGQLKELRRFLRDGEVAESGETAKITLADTKNRAVYLKKIDGRWFLENRQSEK